MNSFSLAIAVLLFSSAYFFLGTRVSTTQRASGSRLHSLPHYYGLFAGLVAAIPALLLLAVMDLPSLGDAMAPVHQHVAPRYLAESGSALHIPNVVTTVLASYRGFDTLGETIVVFAAGLGVLMLLAGATRTNRVKADNRKMAAKTAKPKTNKPQTAKPKSATKTARTKA